MARIERIVDEEIARLMTTGPTASELEKVRARNIAGMVRSLESISNKATILATSETYLGSPDAWKRDARGAADRHARRRLRRPRARG